MNHLRHNVSLVSKSENEQMGMADWFKEISSWTIFLEEQQEMCYQLRKIVPL